jgi:hypothetical protein
MRTHRCSSLIQEPRDDFQLGNTNISTIQAENLKESFLYRRLGNVGNRKLSNSNQQKIYHHTNTCMAFTVFNLTCTGKTAFYNKRKSNQGNTIMSVNYGEEPDRIMRGREWRGDHSGLAV